jgi:hypothetical protein
MFKKGDILIAKKSLYFNGSIGITPDITPWLTGDISRLTIGGEYKIKYIYGDLGKGGKLIILDNTLKAWILSFHETDFDYYGKFFYTKKEWRDMRLSTLLENIK